MEMCYDGALVMPSSYAVMDEEEMMYLEGGGTVTVTASAKTMKIIANATANSLGTAVGCMFSVASGHWWTVAFVAGISGTLCAAITNFVVNISGGYRALNHSWTIMLLPEDITINLDKIVGMFN